MERYGTFKVDHTKLTEGIYLSRMDVLGESEVSTIDIRLTRPYVDEVMSNMVLHSIEHILATELENTDGLKKVYFGPMGCCTGFYYLFSKSAEDSDVNLPTKVGITLYSAIENFGKKRVPFNTKLECGNCYSLARTDEEYEEVYKWLEKIKSLAQHLINTNEFYSYSYL